MLRKLSLPIAAAALLALAPAAAAQDQQLKPENPVGPVSFHPYKLTAPLPAPPGQGEPRPAEPQSALAPYDGPPLVLQKSFVGRKAAEPTMGVDADGVAFYAAGAFDGLGGQARTEVLRSSDGGLTWSDTTFQLANEDFPPNTLDPYVYVDRLSGRVFSIDLLLAGSFLAYSDDKGETWTPSAMEAPGVNDHQTFFTGPPPAGNPAIRPQDTFPNVAYYCVNSLTAATCSYSDDGGRSFRPMASPPFAPCVGCLHGHGVVDSEGRIFLPRGDLAGMPDRNLGPTVSITENGGLTWEVVRVSPEFGPAPSDRHTAVAVDAADNVYYVWWDQQMKLPWLSVSRDHGKTWGKPLMVAPPGVHDVNFPQITAGEAGRIAISFPGSSVDDQTDETRPWHAWVVVSTNALDENPLFVGAIADNGDDPVHRGTCDGRCAGMFDFLDIESSPKDGTFWATFTDTCTDDNECNTTRDTGLATDAQGLAVRQLYGPRLYGEPLTGPGGNVQTGSPAPGGAKARDRKAPKVRSLRVTRRGRVSTLRWKLSERASVRVQVKRGRKTVTRAQTGRPAREGSLKLGKLRRGRYAVALTPTDPAGNRGKAKRLKFRR